MKKWMMILILQMLYTVLFDLIKDINNNVNINSSKELCESALSINKRTWRTTWNSSKITEDKTLEAEIQEVN